MRAFYYPDFIVDELTLKKAILLFDEIHFMDRVSVTFRSGFGTIGAQSPLRQFERSFRDAGVPFYVHDGDNGPVQDEAYRQICSDISDPEFMRVYIDGLRESESFCALQIHKGNYGAIGDEIAVRNALLSEPVQSALASFSPVALFEDTSIKPFSTELPEGLARWLVFHAVTCSSTINRMLAFTEEESFVPLADATPFGALLAVKQHRAASILAAHGAPLQISDLGLAVIDQFLPTKALENVELGRLIEYRKRSDGARRDFLNLLHDVQKKQGELEAGEDYESAIRALVDKEVRPAAIAYGKKLDSIDEGFLGGVAKRVMECGGVVAAGGMMNVFALNWPVIVAAGSVALGTAAVDTLLARRAAQRESSLSYVLTLAD